MSWTHARAVVVVVGIVAFGGACPPWNLLPGEGVGEGEAEVCGAVPDGGDEPGAWSPRLTDTVDINSLSSTSDGEVFVTTSAADVGDILRFDGPETAVLGTCGGSNKVGPVLLGDDGAYWVGLREGVGRIDPTTTACTVVSEFPGVERVVGLAVGTDVVVWTGHDIVIIDPATVRTVVTVIDTADPAENGTFVLAPSGLQLVLGGLRRAISVDVVGRTIGTARDDVDGILGDKDVRVVLQAPAGRREMLVEIGGAPTPAVPVAGPAQDFTSTGDRAFVVATDDVNSRVLVGGPAGFVAVFTASTATLLTTPRLPAVFHMVAGFGGEQWGLADDAIAFWTRESMRTNSLPDQVIPLDVTDTVGAVALGPGQLLVRAGDNLRLVDATADPVVPTTLKDTSSQVISSSAGGDPGFDGVNTVVEVARGFDTAITVYRLSQNDRARADDVAVVPFGPVCAAESCRALAAAVAPDGRGVATLRRGEGTLILDRCSITLGPQPTVGTCTELQRFADADAASRNADDVRLVHGLEGVAGAVPGTIFSHRVDEAPVTFAVDDTTVRSDVRFVGDCVVAGISSGVFVGDLATSTFTIESLDSTPLGFGVAVDEGRRTIIVVGGKESFAGIDAAAQLYAVPVAGCLPCGSRPLGPRRSQADITGLGVRADGASFVLDAEGVVWQAVATP